MRYRKLARTGEMVSVLGYGLMRLPGKDKGGIDIPKSKRLVDMGIDGGINVLDSAYTYGQTEHFAGEHILPDRERSKINVVGKLPIHRFNSLEGYKGCLQEELRRYATDYIDYYLIHMANIDSFEKAVERGVLTFLDQALEEGKIRHAGISIHDNGENIIKIIDAYDKWTYVQLQYNIVDATPDMEKALDHAHAKGISVFVMEPLLGGFLATNLPPSMQKVIDEAPVKRSIVEWAFRFVYNHPAVVCVLSGMNEEEQVVENLRLAEQAEVGCLTEGDKAVYDALRQAYDNLALIGCTGCRYCMPCPAGIDIPFALKTINLALSMGEFEHSQFLYHATVSAVGMRNDRWAKNCIDCGACEKVCPQHLQIREGLKKVVEHFEKDTDAVIEHYRKINADKVEAQV